MRLGVDEVGVTELMGVTEHARAMATAAAALLLESLVGGQPLVPPLALGAADDRVRALLDEIAAWSREALGSSEIPLIWRILGHNPDFSSQEEWLLEREENSSSEDSSPEDGSSEDAA